ncbi:hypothetical protein SPRG_02944 [Saprolegnia parasitica CBS 223.65]|uniref:Uncharacterized protein n=1 Tax=Saprolegnia parasitica (strain CBS 223.65) TaxID=695850 RepID=A0A067D087_SAPPC|nr:hypothetical protein SPRG_02944 [Saprolegnia parasitica CBS 223.65]KDO32467.1 hypothetical protein SPRG_02944 [Saprolegnia parasitica CBS 223.65]|eukprot:XP_012196918.1 hypothetical protein SPRG_02944 [Saprolegnia parasitica CBS 223.65]
MVAVNRLVNPGIAAHEAAMRKYRAAKTFAYANKVPNDTLPEISVKGVDGLLQWPLPPAQEQQLFARYTAINGCITVPLEDIRYDYRDDSPWEDSFDEHVLDAVDLGLGMTTTNLCAYFSHMCLDTTGSVDAFTPDYIDAEDFDTNLFGTLVVVLPAPYNGGKITVAFDGASTSVQLKPLKKAMRFLATYRNTTLASSPITSGYRAALVYHLVGVNLPLDDTSLLPVPRHESISAFAAIAATPLPPRQRIARPIRYEMEALVFGALKPAEADFVDLLVATQCYDIALVQFTTNVPRIFADIGALNIVAASVPHPSCRIPKIVAQRLLGKRANAFLKDAGEALGQDNDIFACSAAAILFWPKACRVGIVGVEVAFPLLKKAISNSRASKLGLHCADDLVHGAIGLFQSMPPQYVLPFKYVTMMNDALVNCNNVAMAELFLGDAISVSNQWSETDMIYLCLATYGWPALEAAMLRLIQRWVKDDVRSISRLLANLAGATKNGKCTPLKQPFVCEFFKRCWHEVLIHQSVWPSSTIDEYIVLMDGYLHDMAPLVANGHWLNHKLPPALVSVVDSFLYKHRRGVYTLLSLRFTTEDRLKIFPELLLKATALQPTLNQKATSSFEGGYCLLRVMDQIGRCDERLMEKVALLNGYEVVIAVSWLVTKHATIAASTRASAIIFLDTCAVTLLQNAENEEVTPDIMVDLVMATVVAFNDIAPEKIPSFLTKWIAKMPPTFDTNRNQLFPVIKQVTAMFPGRFRDAIVALATRCRAIFLDDARRTPSARDLSVTEAQAFLGNHFLQDRDLASVATLDALLAPPPTTAPPKGGERKSRKRRRHKH